MKKSTPAVLQSSIENAIELAVSLKTQGLVQDENVVNIQLEKLIRHLADANWALAALSNQRGLLSTSERKADTSEFESWSIY